MRRVGRRIVRVLTAVSLLLCLATCAAWFLSLTTGYLLTKTSGTVSTLLGVSRGDGAVLLMTYPGNTSQAVGWRFLRNVPAQPVGLAALTPPTTHLRFAGCAYVSGNDSFLSSTCSYRMLVLPLWIAALAFGLPPLVWGGRTVRRAYLKLPDNACVQCAYDLTGNVSGVCPECGAAVAKA